MIAYSEPERTVMKATFVKKVRRWFYRRQDSLSLALYRFSQWLGAKMITYREAHLMLPPYAVRTLDDRWGRTLEDRR